MNRDPRRWVVSWLMALGFALWVLCLYGSSGVTQSLGADPLTQGWIQVLDQPGSLERVQAVSPSAQVRIWQGQSVINAGSFSSSDQADVLLQSLDLLGITGQAMLNNLPPTPSSRLEAAAPSLGSITAMTDPPYHLPYPLAILADLVTLAGVSRPERLHRDAAQAFVHMQAAARQSGIQLVPLSGYRDMSTQTFLFQRQIQRRGSERAARFLSAPPGFSEHHTGYALDIGDGSQPYTHVQYAFAQTAAYGWLQAQAGSYGFELSFPLDNPQGISFEPWHWRYVGTAEARQLFAQARQL